jgi:A/G-specific adenine glycosylase
LLDPNVIRLVGRFSGVQSERVRARDDRRLWDLLADLLPRARAPEFALALVDLGAVICRPRKPRCYDCPLRSRCYAFTQTELAHAGPTA